MLRGLTTGAPLPCNHYRNSRYHPPSNQVVRHPHSAHFLYQAVRITHPHYTRPSFLLRACLVEPVVMTNKEWKLQRAHTIFSPHISIFSPYKTPLLRPFQLHSNRHIIHQTRLTTRPAFFFSPSSSSPPTASFQLIFPKLSVAHRPLSLLAPCSYHFLSF